MRDNSLSNRFVVCEADQKLGLLLHLLRQRAHEKVIVYFATCACVDFVAGQPSWHCLLRYASACAHPCPPVATLQCGLRAVAAA